MGTFCTRKDLTGQKFNMLTVLEYSHTDHNKKAHWICLCDCGYEKSISGWEIRKGQQSCGCIMMKYEPVEPGNFYGRWEVIEQVENCKHNKKRFLCECRCGNQKVVDSGTLKLGKSKSCGCLYKDVLAFKKTKAWKTERKCKLEDCDKKHHSKGFCSKHYNDFYQKRMDERGVYVEGYKPVIKGRVCRYPECDRVGKAKDGLKRGLCSKHRKWATKGIIDLETCEILDPDRIPRQREYYHCKVKGCIRKHKAKGFCGVHYKSFKDFKTIDIDGKRLDGKKKFYDYKNEKCRVRTCTAKINGKSRETRLVKDFCPYHYDLHAKGHYNEFGQKIKDHKTKEEYNKELKKRFTKLGRDRAIKITWNGQTRATKGWERVTKIKRDTLKSRYKAGMPLELVFTQGDVRRAKGYREWLVNKEPRLD
ncbi:hypothetical protein N9948_00785 [bacterium]|nr:hypothetical protein [bacterium]